MFLFGGSKTYREESDSEREIKENEDYSDEAIREDKYQDDEDDEDNASIREYDDEEHRNYHDGSEEDDDFSVATNLQVTEDEDFSMSEEEEVEDEVEHISRSGIPQTPTAEKPDKKKDVEFESPTPQGSGSSIVHTESSNIESLGSRGLSSKDIDNLTDDELKSKPFQLEHEWVFWWDDNRGVFKGMTSTDYESSVKSIGKFATVQDFWRYSNNIRDISRLPEGTNIRLFKSGIKPTWEDPSNHKGGKWSIPTRKEDTHQIWIKLLIMIIGEQLKHNDDLCGIVASIRGRGDTIHIWNKSGDNQLVIDESTSEIKLLTGYSTIKYQRHNTGVLSSSSSDLLGVMSPKLSIREYTPSKEDLFKSDEGEQSASSTTKKRNRRRHRKSSSISSASSDMDSSSSSNLNSYSNGRRLSVSSSVDSDTALRNSGHRKTGSVDIPRKLDVNNISPRSSQSPRGRKQEPFANNRGLTPLSKHTKSLSASLDSRSADNFMGGHKRTPSWNSNDRKGFDSPNWRRPNITVNVSNGLPPPYPKKSSPSNGLPRATNGVLSPYNKLASSSMDSISDNLITSRRESTEKPQSRIIKSSNESKLHTNKINNGEVKKTAQAGQVDGPRDIKLKSNGVTHKVTSTTKIRRTHSSEVNLQQQQLKKVGSQLTKTTFLMEYAYVLILFSIILSFAVLYHHVL